MRVKLSILIVCFCLLLSGCTKDNEPVILVDASYIPLTFEEAVSRSSCIIIGTYEEDNAFPEYYDFIFSVDQVLLGACANETVTVRKYRTRVDMSDEFSVGEAYILLLDEPLETIYQTDDYYFETTPHKMPVNGPYTLQDTAVSSPDGISLADYIRSLDLQLSSSTSSTIDTGIVYATETAEIANKSSYIGYVTILALENIGIVNIDVYSASVTELIKGTSLNTREDGTILLSLTKGSVNVGDQYLVAFNPADEGSIIYTQTTLNSVIPASQQSTIEEITNALEAD